MPERARPHKPFASRTEAASGRRHDVAFFEDLGKDVPGGPSRKADPHIGRVDAAVDAESHLLEGFTQNRGVLLVERHEIVHLLEPLIGKAGQPSGLRDGRSAVEDRGHDPVEVVDDGGPAAVFELGGDHRPPEADAGEARVFRERTSLDRALVGAGDLEDRARAVGVFDVQRVSRIVNDQRAVLLGEGDQLGQLLAGGRGARGVVGRAEEDEVGALGLKKKEKKEKRKE